MDVWTAKDSKKSLPWAACFMQRKQRKFPRGGCKKDRMRYEGHLIAAEPLAAPSGKGRGQGVKAQCPCFAERSSSLMPCLTARFREEEQRAQAGGDSLATEQVLRYLSSRGWCAPEKPGTCLGGLIHPCLLFFPLCHVPGILSSACLFFFPSPCRCSVIL